MYSSLICCCLSHFFSLPFLSSLILASSGFQQFLHSFWNSLQAQGNSLSYLGMNDLMGSFYSASLFFSAEGVCFGKFSISLLSFPPVGSASTSIFPFCFLFLGPFVTPIRVRGDTRGHTSSSSHDPFTPARMHSRLMVAGWGSSPLLLLRWYPLMEPSIKLPTLILYPFKRAYKIMASCSLTEHRCLVGIITEAMK